MLMVIMHQIYFRNLVCSWRSQKYRNYTWNPHVSLMQVSAKGGSEGRRATPPPSQVAEPRLTASHTVVSSFVF